MSDSHFKNHVPCIEGQKNKDRLNEALKVTVVGAVTNFLLAVGKLTAGILGSSSAMVADAVHSLSDLVTDVVVYVSATIAAQEADEAHPYGHGRAETIGAAVMGAVLIVVGIIIVFEVIDRLMAGEVLVPTWPAICGALVSIVANEWLYFYTVKIGRKINNDVVVANAWHHRTDSISSVAALIGIGGAMAGFPLLDPLAAIVIVFLIVKVGGEIMWKAFQDLMDRSASPEQLEEIKEIIMHASGVRHFHELRARRVGGDIFVDAHIVVQPNISVSEAHNIAETVRYNLKDKVGVADALIHIDAEDDMTFKLMLVDREKMAEKVRAKAESVEGVKGVWGVTIHYLAGKMCVEFSLEMDDSITIAKAKELAVGLKEELLEDESIDTVVIHGSLTGAFFDNEAK
ncbi:Cobalt-zinc-cadmium resistance protein [hydrothermal vent metagenome]|uniref:Cobalt-zinc-cadmium resistance protein n=1 Tax=hydrothermal vent metagenome TaxID=652676 RepID=A0A3B1BN43_9ZZZZ